MAKEVHFVNHISSRRYFVCRSNDVSDPAYLDVTSEAVHEHSSCGILWLHFKVTTLCGMRERFAYRKKLQGDQMSEVSFEFLTFCMIFLSMPVLEF